MKIVYGTPWIEVEFGQRAEGWKLFIDRDKCINTTKEDSRKGAGADGYIGPVRPLIMYEIPFDILPPDVKKNLKTHGTSWTANNWNPKYKDSGTYI